MSSIATVDLSKYQELKASHDELIEVAKLAMNYIRVTGFDHKEEQDLIEKLNEAIAKAEGK